MAAITATSQPSKFVLSLGLLGPWLDRHPEAGHTTKEIKDTLDAEACKVGEFGVHIEIMGLDPDNEKASLKEVAEMLSSRQWDAVSFGTGIRVNLDFAELMERVLNMTIELSPKMPKLLMPDGPGGLSAAIERVLLKST